MVKQEGNATACPFLGRKSGRQGSVVDLRPHSGCRRPASTPCTTLLSSWGARFNYSETSRDFFLLKHISYVYVNLYVYLYVNRCTQLQMKLRSSLMERKAALPTFWGHLWGNPEAPIKGWIPFPPLLLRKQDSASGQQLSLIRDVKSYHRGLEMPPCQGSQPPTTDFWGWLSLYGASLVA